MAGINLIGIVVGESREPHAQRIVPRLIDDGAERHIGGNRPAASLDERAVEEPLKALLECRAVGRVLMILLQPEIYVVLHAVWS